MTVPHPDPSRPPADDATVIRPLGGAPLAPAPPPPLPLPDDATVIRPPVMPPAPDAAEAPGAPQASAAQPLPPSQPPAPVPPPGGQATDDGTLPLGTRLGEFELTSVLGIGGFGIVYLAHDHSLGRRVALKEYMPSALAARRGAAQVSVKSERHRETFEAGLKSFVNEARLLAQFDHPSLVKVYRFWEANGTAYMVMPFYEGVTLKDRLRELGQAPDEDWLRTLLAPLTEALQVIHGEQCFHRDIAPDNIILLAGSNRPLLLDFGAARRVIGDMTQALTVILKPGYAPLEQYAEVPHMKQGAWTDVYALAAVVYHAITGRTPPVSVGRILQDSFVPLAHSAAGRYSERFLAAVDHALAVRPDDRTPSIAAFRAELGLDGAAPPAHAPQPPRSGHAANSANSASTAPAPAGGTRTDSAGTAPARSRLPALLGGGVAVLLLAAGGAYLALGRSDGDVKTGAAATTSATAPATAAASVPATATAPTATMTAAAPAATVPASAPAPAAAPAAPGNAPFSVLGEFDRAVQAQTAGFSVQADTPLARLRIGKDRLRFTLNSARDGWVTVFMVGPDGDLIRLIPNSGLKEQRISAGKPLTLPPAHMPFDAAEPAGREDFLVIVSSRPRQHQSLGGRQQDGLLTLRPGPALADLAARPAEHQGSVLTGMPAAGCSAADCWDYGATRFSVDVVR